MAYDLLPTLALLARLLALDRHPPVSPGAGSHSATVFQYAIDIQEQPSQFWHMAVDRAGDYDRPRAGHDHLWWGFCRYSAPLHHECVATAQPAGTHPGTTGSTCCARL